MASKSRTKHQKRRRRVRLRTSARNALVVILCVLALGGYMAYRYYQGVQNRAAFGDVSGPEVEEDGDSFKLVEGTVSCTVFNVGAGDAILLKSKDKEALIDTGTEKSADALVKSLKSKVDGSLDYLILTSPAEGRLGGLAKVCDITTCIVGEMGEQEKYVWSNLSDKGKIVNGDNLSYDIGDAATLFVIKPEVSSDDPLDRSLVTYFTFGGTGFLSLSDAGKEEISRAFGSVGTVNTVVLSRNGNAKVNAVVPDYNYQYLVASNTKTSEPANGSLTDVVRGTLYVTGTVGDLEFVSDGENLYLADEDEKIEILKEIEAAEKEAAEKAAEESDTESDEEE